MCGIHIGADVGAGMILKVLSDPGPISDRRDPDLCKFITRANSRAEEKGGRLYGSGGQDHLVAGFPMSGALPAIFNSNGGRWSCEAESAWT